MKLSNFTSAECGFAALVDGQTKSGKDCGLLKVTEYISVQARNRAQLLCPAKAPHIHYHSVSLETAGRATELAWRYFQALQPIF